MSDSLVFLSQACYILQHYGICSLGGGVYAGGLLDSCRRTSGEET